jgi:hypothetical protein
MRFVVMLALLAALLGGCARSEEVYFPDGSVKGYRITCESTGATMVECFQKADAICGEKGYDITHRQRRPSDNDSLLIRCRTPS